MKPYRDFDLPTRHLEADKHFVPPKARDEAEIERRRSQPYGVLLAESEQKGIAIARTILSNISEEESINFASDVLSAAKLNSSWYLFGHRAPTMRRRLKLEVLDAEDPEQRPSAYMLHQNVLADLGEARAISGQLATAIRNNSYNIHDLKKGLGRSLGHSALTLACLPLGDRIGYDSNLSNFDLQAIARQRGLRSLQIARSLCDKIGTPPSIAQLAFPVSDLSVYWQRSAPDEAFDAYQTALDTDA